MSRAHSILKMSARIVRTRAKWAQIFFHKLILAPIFFIILSAFGADLPDYFLRVWKTDNGLPDNAVTAIVQTRDGYLWLGTYGGLARFDGIHFTIFSTATEPELHSDRVTSLFEDAQGTLWIGHERGDLTSYHDGKFFAQTIKPVGVRRIISAINSDEHDDLWLLNEEGTLLRARDGATCALPNADGVALLARDQQRKLWITSNGQLGSLENGELNLFTNFNSPDFAGGYIEGVCASRGGGLWIATDSRVRKWNGGVITEDRGTNLFNSKIGAMLETQSGALAMGTSDDGLYLLFPNRSWLHFNRANGFPSDWIRCLNEDREGTLWVGTGSGGLVALRPGNVKTLEAPDHWQGRVPLSITSTHDGAFWVGTEGAGIYRFLDNVWKHFGEESGISNQYVWSVSENANGQLWAGTWGGGMFTETNNHFATPAGLENVTVPMPAIFYAADGVTWIGTASGLLRYENGARQWFGEKNGLKAPDVRAIAADKNGAIWFGMLGGGLGKLQNGALKQFFKSDGLCSDYIQCLRAADDGTLWIGSYGGGISRLKNGRFTTISSRDGLPNNFISDIEEDGRGNFWISSHGGIFRVTKNALNQFADGKTNFVNCLTYGIGEGMPTLECSGGFQPAAAQTADGRIWFPTSKGIVGINPFDIKINSHAPPVIIEAMIVNGRTVAKNSEMPLKIPPGQQRFEFHYTGLSFVAPEKIQFQYRLAGWDNDWVNANDRRVAEYSYLPPGSYVFNVRAGNSDGVWNQTGAKISFIVLPQFWQTWWFRFATILIATILVAASVLFLTRRRMRRKLEILHRQQAVERERTRIAKDIHDHLGANLTRISLLSQTVHGDLENPAHAATQLDRIYLTSRELTRSMDEIVWAVNPQHDTLDSLASYLGNFAQEFLVPLNIRCRLDVPLHLPHWPITAEMRHNVFLAFKEALHNIVKHSAATEVSIALTTNKIGFELLVRDNGKGFDPATQPSRIGHGNGLKNMRQRMEKIGGHCAVQSEPGTGTEINFSVCIPVANRKIVGS
jgi:ligand-binding sensor domain-containing protein/signal transduction histidine kinase